MKVHQLPPTFWDQHEPSLTLGGHCKRLRPLAPKFSSPNTDDLKSFIRPENHPKKLHSPDEEDKKVSPQVETHLGGTRWNPTQEQIKILEMLYKSGIRTPNAQQIEQITEQLGKYGKIEGKNVFYWFQNHKARERQKQKRNNLTPIRQSQETNYSSSPISTISLSLDTTRDESRYKKKCRSWSFEEEESKVSCEDSGSAAILAPSVNYYGKDVETLASQLIFPNHGLIVPNIKTLELFPLHPEGR